MSLHYELTYWERRSLGGYVAESDNAVRPEMACRTGDGHALWTRDWAKVTCPACLAKQRHGGLA
jgi:hypothetical protein